MNAVDAVDVVDTLDDIDEQIDVIDFQSDVHDDMTAIKPVPKVIKGILAALVIIAVVGVGGMYLLKIKKDEASTTSQSQDKAVMLLDAEEEGDYNKLPVNTKNTVNRSLDSQSDVGQSKAKLTLHALSEQAQLNEQVNTLRLQVQQITVQIESLISQKEIVSQLNTKVSQLSDVVNDAVTRDELSDMRQSFKQSMQQFRGEIKKTLAKNTIKKKNIKRKKALMAKRIPFKLVSIDQWDGVYYAAIRSKKLGAIENLRVGDMRAGWKVASINMAESRVMFTHIKTGQSIKQTVI